MINHYQILWVVLVFLTACKTENKTTTKEETKEETKSITLTPVTNSPEFPDAEIAPIMPIPNVNVGAGEVRFQYDVKNYELGNQTPDADSKLCANSAKGQHIHHILNNEPYGAYYTNDFIRELKEGRYVCLSFLSRSYHESIKSPKAYIIQQFTAGAAEHEDMDLSGPHMFYSRPKGTYLGKDTEKVMLDFYLINTDLSENGNKVRATINGEEFIIDQWVPHFMEGLPMGENSIKLELLDKAGNLIESPFNPVERTVTLVMDEPLE